MCGAFIDVGLGRFIISIESGFIDDTVGECSPDLK